MLLVGCVALHCSVKVKTVINYVSLFILTIIFHFLIPKHVSRHEISPPKEEEKEKQQQSISWQSIFQLCCSSSFCRIRLVPAEGRMCPRTSLRSSVQEGAESTRWDAAAGRLPAGSASRARRGRDPHFHPAGMVTNASALWRPLNVSNSRTCAEAMLCASLKTKLVSHNRTAHALDI